MWGQEDTLSQAIPILCRLGGRNLSKQSLEFRIVRFVRAASDVVPSLQNRQLLGCRGGDKLVHGDPIIRREALYMRADGIRQMDGQGAHGDDCWNKA
jgi:hypothetical protein